MVEGCMHVLQIQYETTCSRTTGTSLKTEVVLQKLSSLLNIEVRNGYVLVKIELLN